MKMQHPLLSILKKQKQKSISYNFYVLITKKNRREEQTDNN